MLDPNYNIFKFDEYPDAEFSVMYRQNNPDDLSCANSCTGIIIKFADCTFLWISKLQTETALFTIEPEIISLAHCCLELFPIINMTQSLKKSVGLPVKFPSMNVSVQDNNSGELILASTLTQKFTPLIKYYATWMIWFQEDINKMNIELLKLRQLRIW